MHREGPDWVKVPEVRLGAPRRRRCLEMAYDMEYRVREQVVPTRSAVAWGAVFSGVLIGVAVMVALSLLWYALGTDRPSSVFADKMGWWFGGSAILATLVAGFFAGWLTRGGGVMV